MSPEPLLQVRDLIIGFPVRGAMVPAVDGVSFDLGAGEFLALVGESGCGKSMTALSILRLHPDPPAKILSGSVRFNGLDLLELPERELRRIRGREIAMVFQEPMTSLNPVFSVGEQVAEAVRAHENVSRGDARARAVESLRRAGVPDAEKRYGDYPHQLSGGMRQRVMIAMALVARPRILLADEPTTALDVTLQAEILELIAGLRRDSGLAVLLISHDLSLVLTVSDRVAVMYAGAIVESAPAGLLKNNPLHPYTSALMRAIPKGHKGSAEDRLEVIPGRVPPLGEVPPYCRFYDRCPIRAPDCRVGEPSLREVRPGHFARCVKI